jgi:hypothetical protein
MMCILHSLEKSESTRELLKIDFEGVVNYPYESVIEEKKNARRLFVAKFAQNEWKTENKVRGRKLFINETRIRNAMVSMMEADRYIHIVDEVYSRLPKIVR